MLTETLLRIPFSVIGRCSLVPISHWLLGKFARTNLSQAASGMNLQNHRWLPVCIFNVKIVALGSLKRITGRIFKSTYSAITKEQAKTLSLIFPSKNKQKIVKKIISACTESTYLLLKAFRKIFIS
jgi:hypothetical protein